LIPMVMLFVTVIVAFVPTVSVPPIAPTTVCERQNETVVNVAI